MSTMVGNKVQTVVSVSRDCGAYHNFFFTPGSMDSLHNFVTKGWRIVFIKDDPIAQKAIAVFEREIEI